MGMNLPLYYPTSFTLDQIVYFITNDLVMAIMSAVICASIMFLYPSPLPPPLLLPPPLTSPPSLPLPFLRLYLFQTCYLPVLSIGFPRAVPSLSNLGFADGRIAQKGVNEDLPEGGRLKKEERTSNKTVFKEERGSE